MSEKWRAWTSGPLAGRVPVHIVFSPPQRRAIEAIGTDRGYRMLRAELRAVADWVGVQVACAVFHPYRMGGRAGLDYGCREGPHWHTIAVAWARGRDGWVDGRRVAALSGGGSLDDPLPLEDAIHPLTGSGWVVKNLGPRESVYATAGYLLSHAGIASISASASTFGAAPLQTVTWWGYKFDWPTPEDLPGEVAGRFCPICRVQVSLDLWFRLELTTPGEPPPAGAGVTLQLLEAKKERTLKDEWDEWRAARDRFEIERDYSGPDALPRKPAQPGM